MRIWPSLHIYCFVTTGSVFRTIADPAKPGFSSFMDYYIQPYIRALPYIWGILVGYILFKLRGKKLDISWVCMILP